MAIRDLLWACPACRALESLAPEGRSERCRACGARLRRGPGAAIVLDAPGQRPQIRSAREWVDALGEPDEEGQHASGRVILRDTARSWPLRERGELLGYVEKFGPELPGTLTMTKETITFVPDGGGAPRVWPILAITAVQPASSKLQLKVKGQAVVTLRFVDGSVRLWEWRIQQRLRAAWRAAGRGEIVEFQPRVSSR